jgi:hypothetical protein
MTNIISVGLNVPQQGTTTEPFFFPLRACSVARGLEGIEDD